ncbi:hypothetical protein K5D40_08700 [Pseudomonas cichorii]|nr:hypothetical protein [Pseudomonas cichorii]MBX8602317.1 hypothetical protein [Pseudomonas cichorii]MBX8618385.1 hypothetical protein [Pseudomonas cichorii]
MTYFSVVIDADVARSSGTTEHPVSSGSRKLLEAVSIGGHKLVLCPTLRQEWRNHRSKFAILWMASMVAKKKVVFITPGSNISRHISDNVPDSKNKEIALKDAHLIDAALESDKIVASNDDLARSAFCQIAREKREICSIIWMNAISNGEAFREKLLSGDFVPPNYYLQPIAETTT